MPRDQNPPLPLPPIPERDTIGVQLLREAFMQCGLPDELQQAVLAEAGLDARLLATLDTRVSASAYATLWRALERRTDDLFFGMDPRPLRRGSLGFLCRSSMAQPTLAEGLESALAFLGLMLQHFDAVLVRQQSVAQIIIRQDSHCPSRAFADFTFWMIVHGVACWLCGRRIPILGIELRCPEPEFIENITL